MIHLGNKSDVSHLATPYNQIGCLLDPHHHVIRGQSSLKGNYEIIVGDIIDGDCFHSH